MSVYKPVTVDCNCGQVFQITVATSLSVSRKPSARGAIIRRRLHRFRCPGCARLVVYDEPFLYTDLSRQTVICVMSPQAADCWEEQARALDRICRDVVPAPPPADGVALGRRRIARALAGRRQIAFGLEGLRERLVAQDAGLKDVEVELGRALARRLAATELSLSLDAADRHSISFAIWRAPEEPAWRVTLRRRFLQTGAPAPAAAGADQADPFDDFLGGLLNQQDALAANQFRNDYNAALEQDWFDPEFRDFLPLLRQTLDGLPAETVRGNSLIDEILVNEDRGYSHFDPRRANRGLGIIGIGTNAMNSTEAEFSHHVRHEVGHAFDYELAREQSVSIRDEVQNWFDFAMHPAVGTSPYTVGTMSSWFDRMGVDNATAETRALVHLCLGPMLEFGEPYPEADQWVEACLASWRAQLAWLATDSGGHSELQEHIETVAGNSAIMARLLSLALPGVAISNAERAELAAEFEWAGDNFAPRLACLHSYAEPQPADNNDLPPLPKWWENYRYWHSHQNLRFSLNLHYKTLMVIDHNRVAGLLRDSATAPGDLMEPYAVMAPPEMFAELFASFYRPGSAFPEVLRQRNSELHQWFIDTIGAPMPVTAGV